MNIYIYCFDFAIVFNFFNFLIFLHRFELVKIIQAKLVENDSDMYLKEK